MTTGHARIPLVPALSSDVPLVGGRRPLRYRDKAAIAVFIALLAGLLLARSARAQAAGTTVRVPLTIDYLALGAALRDQLYTDKGRAQLWNGSNRCEYLYAENPVFSSESGQVTLETNASLSLGFVLGSRCVSPIWWTGIIAAETRLYVEAGMTLKLRITNLDLYNNQHQKTLIAGKGFDLVKQYFIPRIETFSFALKPATEQLADLAEAASPPSAAARVKQAIGTLHAEPEVVATARGVRVVLDITVPAFATAAAPPAPAELTPEELAAFEKELDQWDAFLVFSIKQLGSLNLDPELRSDLLSLLLDSRHRLVDALASPRSGGPDPVRVLFLDTWQRLGQIVRSAGRRGTLGNRSLEFLSFISAGDALFALDQAAPALGMRISADDLRRLAHIMAPQVTADPLAFSFKEDPELRKMFNLSEPLAEEGPLDTSATELPIAAPGTSSPAPSPATSAAPSSAASASPAGTASPTASIVPAVRSTAAPSAVPSATPTPNAGPVSLLDPFVGFLVGDSAYAAESAPGSNRMVATLQRLGKKLKRAVVTSADAKDYRADMGKLIRLSGEHQLADDDLDERYRTVYMRVVQATAWQESCWRQFVVQRRRVVYLESSSGDIGLMQVNKYVWRGFYSVPRLEWDVLYNAGAGMGILARLLREVATKPGAMSPGKPNELARSVYAAYNGGPGAYRRWRRREPRPVRVIDQSFWSKYQWVLHDVPIDILKCSAEWRHSPGH